MSFARYSVLIGLAITVINSYPEGSNVENLLDGPSLDPFDSHKKQYAIQLEIADTQRYLENLKTRYWSGDRYVSERELTEKRLRRMGVDPEKIPEITESIMVDLVRKRIDDLSYSVTEQKKYTLESALAKDKGEQERETAKLQEEERRASARERAKQSRELMGDMFGHVQSTMSNAGHGVRTVLENPAMAAAGVGIVSGLILSYFAIKRTTKVVADYIDRMLRKPELVRETSRKTGMRRVVSPAVSLINLALMRSQEQSVLKDIILDEKVYEQIEVLTQAIKCSVENNQVLTNLLLYGPPGTGKTLFATKLSKEAGLEYAIVSGADFDQYSDGEGITELRRLIKWAKSGSKPTIIFIDEADAFFGKRQTASEKARKLLNAFLAETGTETNKFMIICATNEPNLIDRAVIDRLDERVCFGLPGEAERIKLIKLYLRKRLVDEPKITLDTKVFSDTRIDELAKKLQGFSGREISKLMVGIRNRVFASGSVRITRAHIDAVVRDRKHQHEEALNYATQL